MELVMISQLHVLGVLVKAIMPTTSLFSIHVLHITVPLFILLHSFSLASTQSDVCTRHTYSSIHLSNLLSTLSFIEHIIYHLLFFYYFVHPTNSSTYVKIWRPRHCLGGEQFLWLFIFSYH